MLLQAIDLVQISQALFVIICLYVSVYLVTCNFITCIGSCTHWHNAELYYHHKDPSCYTLKLHSPSICPIPLPLASTNLLPISIFFVISTVIYNHIVCNTLRLTFSHWIKFQRDSFKLLHELISIFFIPEESSMAWMSRYVEEHMYEWSVSSHPYQHSVLSLFFLF